MGIKSESTQSLREEERAVLKEKRRGEILKAAMPLCLSKGIANVDMKEIAAAAQVSRATLYRYFPSMKDLVFALLRYQAEANSSGYDTEMQVFQGNGYAKFNQFVDQLVDAYHQFPDFFRFMGMIDFYYGSEELVDLYQDLFRGLLLEDTPHLYLEEGQTDGSVRTDIEPRLYTASVIATLVSLSEQMASNQETTRRLYGQENLGIMIETIAEALLRAIKP